MAQVRLGRLEAEEGELPPLCLRCGKPASLYRARYFGWQPGYTYLTVFLTILPFFLITLLTRRRMRVLAPWCPAHRRYGLLRMVLFASMLSFLVCLLVLGTAWLTAQIRHQDPAAGVLLACWIAGPLCLGAVLIVRINALRANEITEESITLQGVAEAFAARWQAERRPGTVSGVESAHRVEPSAAAERSSTAEEASTPETLSGVVHGTKDGRHWFGG